MKYLLLIPALLSTLGHAQAPQKILINEQKLFDFVKESPPNILQLQASYEATKLQRESLDENYDFTLSASSKITGTDERPLSNFQPVFGPVRTHSLTLSRPTKYGATFGVTAYSSDSVSTINRSTNQGFQFDISLDLYKDLLGKTTRANYKSLDFSQQRMKIDSKIRTNGFYQQLRKIYWAIIAIQEKETLSKQLLKASQDQAKDARRRLKSSIADIGEVARYESQVSSRKANIVLLNYEKERLIKQLKDLVPELAYSELIFKENNLQKTIDSVVKCTTLIQTHKLPPLEYTRFDEMLVLLEKEYTATSMATEKHSSLDVSLDTSLSTFGKGTNYELSRDAFSDDRSKSYEIGLNISIPLGSKKSNTEDVKKIVEKKRYLAQNRELMGKIKTFHYQILKNISLLYQVFDNQQENSGKLEISLKHMKKKFKQARVSVSDLINEQDIYLQSNLSEVDTQLEVINTLFEYFSVYSDTPCDINRNVL